MPSITDRISELHAQSTPGFWILHRSSVLADNGKVCVANMDDENDNTYADRHLIVVLHNEWPAIAAALREAQSAADTGLRGDMVSTDALLQLRNALAKITDA